MDEGSLEHAYHFCAAENPVGFTVGFQGNGKTAEGDKTESKVD